MKINRFIRCRHRDNGRRLAKRASITRECLFYSNMAIWRARRKPAIMRREGKRAAPSDISRMLMLKLNRTFVTLHANLKHAVAYEERHDYQETFQFTPSREEIKVVTVLWHISESNEAHA